MSYRGTIINIIFTKIIILTNRQRDKAEQLKKKGRRRSENISTSGKDFSIFFFKHNFLSLSDIVVW